MNDPVNNPKHYNKKGIEVLDVIEAYELPYHLGNVIKYILRHQYKGHAKQDLLKAQFYLNRYLLDLPETEEERIDRIDSTGLKERGYTDEEISDIVKYDVDGLLSPYERWRRSLYTDRYCPNNIEDRIPNDAGREIKQAYYNPEIYGYCAWCDAELPVDKEYSQGPEPDGWLYCSIQHHAAHMAWQKSQGFGP